MPKYNRLLEISSCKQCYHLSHDYAKGKDRCGLTGKEISVIVSLDLPDDCELPKVAM